jgi:4-amino-4-deoxy-L-arabinose transferase-like glycosyltransferase
VLTAGLQRNAFALKAAGLASVANRPAVWLALAAFVLYLPLAGSVLRLHADAVEYIDLARHLSAGDGYLLGVKAIHFRGTEVLHDGLSVRSPLLPLIGAGLFALGFGLPALQIFNALVTAGCAVLVYGIGASLFGRQGGILAGALAALNPMVIRHQLLPMTEALAAFWALLGLWLVVRCQDSPRAGPYLLAGAALGLGYVTRPTGVILAGAMLLGVVGITRERKRLLRPLAAALLGLAIFALPITLYSWSKHGPSLSYSGNTYHFSVREVTDVNEHYGRMLPTAVEFVRANVDFVLKAIRSNIEAYAEILFLDPSMLGYMLPAWPVALYALVRGRYPAAGWLLLAMAAANFFVHAATWSTFARRYQVLTMLLLLPIAVDGLSRLGLGRLAWRVGLARLTALHAAVFAIALAWTPALAEQYGALLWPDSQSEVRSYRGLTWVGEEGWARAFDERVIDWISSNTDRRTVLAHHNPWLFTMFTERPAVRVPREVDARRLRRFLVDYRVELFLLRPGDPDWRENEASLAAMASEGVYVTDQAGSYRIYDTRRLWQQ